jgi:hypothetical protein
VADVRRDTFDADLDLQPFRPEEPDEPIDEYQRLVANPFLALVGWLAAVGLVREAVLRRNLLLFLLSFVIFLLSFFLLQFHCLDCGATRWLLRYRLHACPAVMARRADRRRRRFRGPRLKLQLAGWFWLIAILFVLGMLVLAARR